MIAVHHAEAEAGPRPLRTHAQGARTSRVRLAAWVFGLVGSLAFGSSPSEAAPPSDHSFMPHHGAPAVVDAPDPAKKRPANARMVGGFVDDLLDPAFEDRRRRIPRTARPEPFGPTLSPGERFRFDVTFAGNPAGLAEAEVVGVRPDPRGAYPAGSPLVELRGHARTSGIVSLLATVTDDMTTLVDGRSGAAVRSQNILEYSGWSPQRYKRRVTTQNYEGRGYVRIEDQRDEEIKKKRKHVPLDTFDPLSAMAWVRSLELAAGDRAKAHAIDGTTLMRIEVESKGTVPMPSMPSIGTALGLGDDDVTLLEGTLTRVDAHDRAVPGKRVFKMRAWISNDARRIPLALESDMWVGAIRLVLTSYDPPTEQRAQG